MSSPQNDIANDSVCPSIGVLVLHENDTPSILANTLLSGLQDMFQDVVQWRLRHWSFHQLERLDIRAMAGHLGKEATVLILCKTTHEEMPESLTTWLERTFQSPQQAKPMIICLEQDDSVAKAYSAKLAANWKVPLVCHFDSATAQCWQEVRDFIEHHISGINQEVEEELATPEKTLRGPCSGPLALPNICPNQAIRDRAYELWVSAGSPDGKAQHFWFLAEKQIHGTQNTSSQPTEDISISPNKQTYENTSPTAGFRYQPAIELMLKLSSILVTGPRDALLQHLARAPQELLNSGDGTRERRVPSSSPYRSYAIS
jgi:hypothetical protein